MIQRVFNVKVYSNDGTTLQKNLTTERPDDATALFLKNTPQFRTRINGGQGECVLDVKAPFDDFSEGTVINFMNVVKIYSVTINTSVSPPTQTTTLIYTGYISRYEPYIDPTGAEGVHVTCLGLVSLLTRSYYGAATAYAVTQTTVDPETIGKDVIDKFNAVYGGSLLGYAGSTSTVGTNVSYTFTEQKWFDALNTVAKLAGTGWWWAVREDGKYYLKAKPGTATHRLTIGRDVESIRALKDSEKAINDVILKRSGGTVTTYTDLTSQSTFGLGVNTGNNCTQCSGQTVSFPANNYTSLSFLALAVNGNQTGKVFTVTYSDSTTDTFTQSFSDWGSAMGYTGETVVKAMAYRDLNDGTRDSRTFNLSGYSFALNAAKQAVSVTLPSASNVIILALDVTKTTALPVVLSHTIAGIVKDGASFGGGIDGTGAALSANLLGASLVWNGAAYYFGTYTGKLSEILSDTSITDATTANQKGNKEIADKKDAKVSAQVTVNTNYAIDTIHVGDTCEVLSYRKASTFFGSNNMLIVSTDYKGDRVVLELEQITNDLGTALNAYVNG